jgi:quinol monooxygenase YgiN
VVFSVIRIYPMAKHRSQVIDLLQSVQDLTLPTPGCLGCSLSEEDFSHNYLRYAEQWESEETLHKHLRSELYRRVLSAMELSKRPPEVAFYHCTKEQGFELIESARTTEVTTPRMAGEGL